MHSRLQASIASPTFSKLSSHKPLDFTPVGVSEKVLIPVPSPTMEGLELVYFFSPGDLCYGAVGDQKYCLNITGIYPYGSQSNKYSVLGEGPMILVHSSANQVSVMAFLNL